MAFVERIILGKKVVATIKPQGIEDKIYGEYDNCCENSDGRKYPQMVYMRMFRHGLELKVQEFADL